MLCRLSSLAIWGVAAVSAAPLGVVSGGCSPTQPPVWPEKFKIVQRKTPVDDPDCKKGPCSDVTTYYDWSLQANLIIDHQDGADRTMWDLELGTHHSFYFFPEVRQCKSMDFTVGILRRDWLKDANFTGYSTLRGRKVLGYTKLDFIDYWADAETCAPVRWAFHGMPGNFDTVSYFEDEAVPDESFFHPPAYCKHAAADAVPRPPPGAADILV